MSKKQNSKNKYSWPVLAPLSLILFVGIITSLIQMRQTTYIATQAENRASADAKDCSVPSGQLQISSEEQKLLDQINAYRQQNGLNTLTWSDSLVKAAKWMSADMLANKYLNHTDSLGRTFNTRLTDCGYYPYLAMGENLDSGAKDSNSTFQAWKASPGHNANMLNNKFREAGIGFVYNSAEGSYYWTLDFGNRSQIPTTIPTAINTPIPTSGIIPTAIPTTAQISSTPTQSYISPSPTLSITPYPTNRTFPTAVPTVTFGPSPTIVPGFTPNPLDMQIFVSAKLIGIGEGGNRNPVHLSRKATVSIYDMKNQLVAEGYGFLIYDRINLFRGIIHFGPIDNGTYFIKILTPHMLKSTIMPTFQVLNGSKLNILPEVTLIQGDINDDNVVNITDYNLALSCFQNKKCQNKELIDFNDDTRANIIDYNILLHDYWESQGD